MIEDLTISYTLNGVEVTLTINDDCYNNLPYNLADMLEMVIRASNANPQMVIEKLQNEFQYDKKEILP